MNVYYIIAGGIILIGLIFLGYSLVKVKKKHKAIKHYEEIRDKLTLREKEEKEEELDYSHYKGGGFGNIIGGFIVILIGAALLPEVSKQVNVASQTANVTGSAETILGLVTIFFALAILAAAVSMVASSLRSVGVL